MALIGTKVVNYFVEALKCGLKMKHVVLMIESQGTACEQSFLAYRGCLVHFSG